MITERAKARLAKSSKKKQISSSIYQSKDSNGNDLPPELQLVLRKISALVSRFTAGVTSGGSTEVSYRDSGGGYYIVRIELDMINLEPAFMIEFGKLLVSLEKLPKMSRLPVVEPDKHKLDVSFVLSVN